jgi:DNA topoisomerase-3
MRLVIAEKPSVAQSIAAVIGAKERKGGSLQGSGYIVSWCVGHLLELAQPETYDEKYAIWLRNDLPILPERWQYVVSKGKEKQIKILCALMVCEDVDSIVCATDAGREGELIFRLVYTYCGCTKPVQRLWISSMEENAIAEGFRTLKDSSEYDGLYQSALCRLQADWLVGINATRLFSVLYGQTLHVGRVQSPTLAMIVRRETDIAAFTSTTFYNVVIALNGFAAASDRLSDKSAIERILGACLNHKAIVKTVERKDKAELPPKLYDLTTLQREANRLHGYTAQQTLDYIQSLYEKKLCTYPRTDSRYLTEDMADGLPVLVNAVVESLPFMREMQVCINSPQVINNAKVSDHHAIIPTLAMYDTDLSALPAGERSILYMIATRLICAMGNKHDYSETTVTLDCAGYVFTAKGKVVLSSGWKDAEQQFRATLKQQPEDNKENAVKPLPALVEGQTFDLLTAAVKEGRTAPPKHFTEDTLLAAMETAGAGDMSEDTERKGLGTPATRAGILEKLVKTGLAQRKAAKKINYMLPTEKGVALVAILPEPLKSPALTAEWEERLKQVERGEFAATGFMNGIVTMTRELVQTYTADANATFPSDREDVGVCPRCGGHVTEGKKGFSCENRDCDFMLWKDNRFFSAKKKELTREIAAALLKNGRAELPGCYSEKTGKTYDAVVILDVGNGSDMTKTSKYVNFKLEFKEGKKHE